MTSIALSAKAAKLMKLCDAAGFDCLDDLLAASISDGVCPAICMTEGCDCTTEMEPDQEEGYCEACGCVYRKLRGSDVLVVQPADERMRGNTSDPLNRTRYRGILVQGTMSPRLIVITCVRAQDATQVLLAQCHHVVNAFAADGANQSFGKTILPRRSCRNRLVANAHGP